MNCKIDEYLDYIRNIRNYSEHTKTNYLIDLEEYESYIDEYKMDYKTISYKQITDYIAYLKAEKKYTSTSINRHLSSLRSFYDFLLSKKVIKSNPFKLVNSLKKEKKLPNYMKYDEFVSMIESCGEDNLGIRNRCILETLLATGARIGELINLKINDIDFNSNELKVLGKGNKERICFFNDYTKDALINYIDNARPNLLGDKQSDYVFINHIGGVLTTRGIRDILNRIIKTSAIKSKITPHTFRHTFATMLLNEGCELKSVQEMLGHVSLSTTSIYTHITNDRIKDIYLHSHPRSK